jgi:hypothetical protein
MATREFGILAEFGSAEAIYRAAERIRDAGYTRWDTHTPFPVHGLDRAMGVRPSMLGWIVFAMGLTGVSGGLLLQWWTAAVDYPIVISGKPFFSWPAFVPICFEVLVLFSALGAVFGMLHLNRLPRLHHPLFASERFERVTDDKFFVSIEAVDPKYDSNETAKFLKLLGAAHVEHLDNAEE